MQRLSVNCASQALCQPKMSCSSNSNRFPRHYRRSGKLPLYSMDVCQICQNTCFIFESSSSAPRKAHSIHEILNSFVQLSSNNAGETTTRLCVDTEIRAAVLH